MKNYQVADEIKLVFSGNDYFDVLEQIINESRETLYLQTYIFENDATGTRIASSLINAARRNVQVYVLLDAYGCYPFSKDMEKTLKEAGVHFRLFSPLFSSESGYFGRRLHHKIIVADKKIALTGGINIADKYSGINSETAWLDYAILTKGKVCEYLHWLCDQFHRRGNSRQINFFEKSLKPVLGERSHLIRFRRNDWIKNRNEIYKSYVEAIIGATDCITIVASYFLPGNTIRKLLKSASARGVKINIILAGQSDIPTLRLAEHFMYDFYLKNKINIFEWTNSVMHGKAMIVDNQWATVGSYNLNLLSHYISVELNTDIIDPGFLSQFGAHLQDIMHNNCNVINLKKTGNEAGFFKRFKMWLFYHFYRLLINAMMAGRKHRKRKH
ncbi:MAG: phospholipase D-like domain-containing protein [Bacteroidota bacterium]